MVAPRRPGSGRPGSPVIPVAIDGSYEVWPRWDRGIRRATVRITFTPPLTFPRLDHKTEREAALQATAERIMGVLAQHLPPDQGIAHRSATSDDPRDDADPNSLS